MNLSITRLGPVPLVAALLAPHTIHADPPAGNWQYLWGDDFSGTNLNSAKWNNGTPDWGMSTAAPTQIRTDHVGVEGGELTLRATRLSEGGSEPFAGGIISTYQKHNFSGGWLYIEARILLPQTPGSWPAFWALYTGWPPEMDIMEYPIDSDGGVGYSDHEYHTAFHYVPPGGGNAAGAGKVNPGSAGDLGGSYHTFGALWKEDTEVRFFFDGAEVSNFTNGAEVAEMEHLYLILNYAVGGWPGTPSTAQWPVGHSDETKVDWVRVWRAVDGKTSNWSGSGAGANAQWNDATNWTNGVPNLGGVTSTFSTIAETEQTIDIDNSRTTSVINLNGSTRYRFGWNTDRLILGAGNSGAMQPAINVAASTTTEHEIWSQLEWSGTLGINNDSSHPLLLTGTVEGGDGISLNGPGVVSFDGNHNPYSGTTVIDSGAAGTGVARARGKSSLGSGLIVIGEQGNNTTARLELENGSLVSNEISLSGRHTATAAIVNNGGNNTISGTVHAQVGGGNYWIQANAGQLRLSGGSDAAGGVAIDSWAGGTRTFTLQGAGDGAVSGSIDDGNATVNLVKSGTGTWTFDAPNTYTGTTTVSDGTLAVNGTTGAAATTVNSGATLSGSGTVRSNLSAQNGATIRVGGSGMPFAFELIDAFETYPPGDIGAMPNATADRWTGVFDGTANADIVDTGGNRALAVNGTNAANGWRGAITDLKSAHASDFSLLHGQTGTYFFRVRRTGSAAIDAIFGLTDQTASTISAPGNDTGSPWDEYAVMLSIFGDSSNGMLRAYDDGDGDVNVGPITSDQWINVWVTVDNDAKTYRVATSTGSGAGTDSGRAYDFGRRTAATVADQALVTFGFHEARNVAAQIDDLHYAPGTWLTNPLAPAPTLRAETLSVENNLTLSAGSLLEFDIVSPSLHDKLLVGGQLNASGTLRVQMNAGAPSPSLHDSFDLFDSTGGSVNFASLDLPALDEGLKWDTSGIGTGHLSVVADPTSYAGWVLGHSFAPGTEGPSFDVEPDGLPNAFEWLFGTDPHTSDSSILPEGQLRAPSAAEFPDADPSKSHLSFSATIRKDISGMTLIPQAAASLEQIDAPGSSDPIATRLLNDLGDFEEREWTYTIPVEDSPTGFMRLKLIED